MWVEEKIVAYTEHPRLLKHFDALLMMDALKRTELLLDDELCK